MTDQTSDGSDLTDLTAHIVSAFVSKNRVEPSQVAALIVAVHQSLTGLAGEAEPEAEVFVPKTRAEIKKSITGEHLISFIDGKKYRTLKRHVGVHDLTLADYRERFGLPHDYPSTAPGYSAARSAMAKLIGLGQKGRKAKAAAPKTKPATKAREPKTTVTED